HGKRYVCRSGLALSSLIRLPGGFSMMSAFLFCRSRTRELSLGTIMILSVVKFGFLPDQNGFTLNVRSAPLFHWVSIHSPLPIGFWKKAFAPCAFTSFS